MDLIRTRGLIFVDLSDDERRRIYAAKDRGEVPAEVLERLPDPAITQAFFIGNGRDPRSAARLKWLREFFGDPVAEKTEMRGTEERH